MPYIRSGQSDIYYQSVGSGRPVILVHGWTLSHEAWDPQVTALSDRYRVIAVDLRGHGDSDKPASGYTLDSHAVDMLALADQLGLERATIVGWSMGGPVSMRALAMDSSRFAQAVMVCAPPKLIATDEYPHGVTTEAARGRLDAYRVERPDTLEGFIVNDHVLKPLGPKTMEWLWQIAMKTPTWAGADCYEHVIASDTREQMKAVKLPVLVMHGRQDPFVPYSAAGWMVENLHDARLVTFEASAHAPSLEEPAFFNQALKQFLAEAD